MAFSWSWLDTMHLTFIQMFYSTFSLYRTSIQNLQYKLQPVQFLHFLLNTNSVISCSLPYSELVAVDRDSPGSYNMVIEQCQTTTLIDFLLFLFVLFIVTNSHKRLTYNSYMLTMIAIHGMTIAPIHKHVGFIFNVLRMWTLVWPKSNSYVAG